MSRAPVHQPPDSWWVPQGEESFPWLGVLLFGSLCLCLTILLVVFLNGFNAKPLDTYSHVMPGMQAQAVAEFADAMGGL